LLPGERTDSEGKAIGNRILLSLPQSEYQALRRSLSFVHLPHHASLHEPGEKIEFAYFPNPFWLCPSSFCAARQNRGFGRSFSDFG